MELGSKFSKLSEAIYQNLLDAKSSSYLGFSANYPLYFLERVAKHLVKNGLVENYFESSDFDKLQLDQDILLEVSNSIDRDIEQSPISELRKLCKECIDLLLANRAQWRSAWIKGKSDNYSNSLMPDYILYDFIIDVVKPSQNQIIYQPHCNLGSMFIRLNKEFPNCNLKFIGQDSHPQDESFVCKINLFANGLEKVASIYSENPLDLSTRQIKAKADIAIATNYPHGSLYPTDEYIDISQLESGEKIRTYEVAYIELMLSSTKDNGKVIAVVPESFLVNNQSKSFRKKYLENDLIEKIISLPKNVFNIYSSLSASIIVLNKEKSSQNKGFVIFDGKDKIFEKTRISISEIKSQKVLNLRPFIYASKESKEVESILSKYPQNEVKKIKDLIVSSVSGFNYSPNDRIIENSSETLPYVRIADLSKNDRDFTLDISKVERKISPEKAHRRTIINFSSVLVSKIAPKLKPTYFNFTGQPIVIGSDIIALKMKEDVNVEYFLTQLHSRLVQIQVEMMSSGTTINRITKEDFLNIQIILPPLEEQQRQILEMRGIIEEKAIAQEKVAKAEQRTDTVEYEVIANMNHSLKNKLGVIINDYDTLIRFLQRKERTNSAVSFDDTIRPVFEGENATEVDTIRLITERLKSNLLDTSKVFNTSLKLQTRELKKTPVELVSYFRNELIPSYAGENFTIEVVAEPKLKLNVLLDREVFKDAIDNLINNAKAHGFTDKEREYKIVFELSKAEEIYDEENESVINYARIVYENDGNPFPKGFSFNDYVRYSSKAGKTQGAGIGGAVIDRIIKMHGGKFNELPTDEFSEFSVQFEILLPLDE